MNLDRYQHVSGPRNRASDAESLSIKDREIVGALSELLNSMDYCRRMNFFLIALSWEPVAAHFYASRKTPYTLEDGMLIAVAKAMVLIR